jgi:hypothetical protein
MGRTRLLSSFLHSNIRKLQLKFVDVQVITPQVSQAKSWRDFIQSSTKTNEVPNHNIQSNKMHYIVSKCFSVKNIWLVNATCFDPSWGHHKGFISEQSFRKLN